MISVDDALALLFDLVSPSPSETVTLRAAAGRVLAEDVRALRDQPPFDASAMDGYAVRSAEVAPGASFRLVGEAAAGHRFPGRLAPGQAVRIFTGAPLPDGADRVVIQEDVTASGDVITLGQSIDTGPHVRPAAADFAAGARMEAPRRLGAHDIALLAAMNIAELPVTRRPTVAIIATGDELVMPGEEPGPDQIIASNSFGLAALVEAHGAVARLLPIARDNIESLQTAFHQARGADLILTIGGASVGDHDLVGDVAATMGLERSFYKIAMRPGKPLMAGRMEGSVMVGLPGNPVSAMVCGHVFILPMLRAMQGLGAGAAPSFDAPLGVELPQNGPRAHYMRASLANGVAAPAASQDSALLGVLARADILMIRPPHDPARGVGEMVKCMHI
ncbi:molybdopterin molybdenumtransferase MoeA [Pelagivirga sediminicola]|uniref:Molybdopterin molybdenumtransferase n=1 Tax=Pelagivirga sediminicola TaxID=2170575 RepID=A0A2T7GCD3_9RHOB|nr:gephyrin-like molybdotransferase Glp [Pelagivirga sediminicola]PVA12076.1 molybdopterin molybdenumtransferase MoeA [Pelagivirga sediminicola]